MSDGDLLPALPGWQYDDLRDSIKQHGVIVPVLVSRDGTIIDGHTRARIAGELDVEPPRHIVDTDDPESMGLVVNTLRRHLDPGSRQRIIEYLVQQGVTQQQIANHVGVNQSTVSRAPGSGYAHAYLDLERSRRRSWVAYLRGQGASQGQIAAAMGIPETTVKHDIRTTGAYSDGRVRKLDSALAPITDWHEKDPPKPKRKKPSPSAKRKKTAPAKPAPAIATGQQIPLYRRSTTLQLWRDVVRQSEHDNAVNRLAHDALEADEHHDLDWYDEARGCVTSARAYLDRLSRLLDDKAERVRCASDWHERDDMRDFSRLRLVAGDKGDAS